MARPTQIGQFDCHGSRLIAGQELKEAIEQKKDSGV